MRIVILNKLYYREKNDFFDDFKVNTIIPKSSNIPYNVDFILIIDNS